MEQDLVKSVWILADPKPHDDPDPTFHFDADPDADPNPIASSVCCKILESVIRDAMMSHLLENNLLKQSQHGFMPRKSCCTNLLEFFEAATSAVDKGKPFKGTVQRDGSGRK